MTDTTIPIYGGRLIVCWSRVEFDAQRDRLLPGAAPLGPSAGKTSRITAPDGSTTYLVGVFDDCWSSLAHELDHVTTWVMQRANINMADSDGEVRAYLMGALCKLCGMDERAAA